MNKRAKQRAFFICAAICVMYIAVGLGFADKLSMKRVASTEEVSPKAMSLAIPKTGLRNDAQAAVTAAPEPVAPPVVVTPANVPKPLTPPPVVVAEPPQRPVPQPAQEVKSPVQAKVEPVRVKPEPVRLPVSAFVREGSTAEPSLFISFPIVCYAIKEGLIEKEGLIFIKKGGYNTLSWKKPLDILKDRDEEGLKSISKAIGKKQILGFLKKEGISCADDSGAEDVILGKGYTVEKKRLLALYDKHVSADYQRHFPYCLEGISVSKGKTGFEFARARDTGRETTVNDQEWMMPNLTNLTIRDAIQKLSARTAKIKVHGNGTVTDQEPKPFQKTSGETECVIYGRANKQ